jgi:hypothetical protein
VNAKTARDICDGQRLLRKLKQALRDSIDKVWREIDA